MPAKACSATAVLVLCQHAEFSGQVLEQAIDTEPLDFWRHTAGIKVGDPEQASEQALGGIQGAIGVVNIAAIESPEIADWATWAIGQADRIDPIRSKAFLRNLYHQQD